MKKQPLSNGSIIENIILIHIIYSLSTKAKEFIHSFIQLSQRCNYVGKLFEGYLYVLWHKPVVHDNFVERMLHMPICGVSQGDVQISK